MQLCCRYKHTSPFSIPEVNGEISWYPGHIFKAEKELKGYLKKVDVVVEVRDGRIPVASAHPKVPEWVGNRPRVVAMVRMDLISKAAAKELQANLSPTFREKEQLPADVVFVDGKRGRGISALREAIVRHGRGIVEKRVRLGMNPRPIRAAIIGFPNVGKSTLINRILSKKLAKTENVPGVTRQISWVRVGSSSSADLSGRGRNHLLSGDMAKQLADSSTRPTSGRHMSAHSFELLDSPGIIPPGRQISTYSALLLAVCNQIGQASYDRVHAARALCIALKDTHSRQPYLVDMATIEKRYRAPFSTMPADQWFDHICENLCQDDEVSAANKLLGDYRKGLLGRSSLQGSPGGHDM